MKKLLAARRFTPNFLNLKPGVVGGYRPNTASGYLSDSKAAIQAEPSLGRRSPEQQVGQRGRIGLAVKGAH
jgi:hypothetical protein